MSKKLAIIATHGSLDAAYPPLILATAAVAIAMELVLLAPFTKFAHAFYRTVALYTHALKPLPERVSASVGSAD